MVGGVHPFGDASLTALNPFAATLRLKDPPNTRWASPGHMASELVPITRQTPALRRIDEELCRVAVGDLTRLMIFLPPQEGKLIADDTAVPTPDGWARHGDLRPGDMVFHPSGRPIKVLEVHAPALASMRVHFSDHTSIMVHPAHEWTVYDRSAGRFVTRETRYFAAQSLDSGPTGRRGHRYRFQLPYRKALDCPPADLPIDPYTLGAMCALADRCGLYGNKHIPAIYLRGSVDQRRALLAGLIDTDGHVAATGQVSFDNTDVELVQAIAELARSLGYRAYVHRPTPPKLSSSGIQGKRTMWRVTFTPHDEGPARLARKAAQRLGGRQRCAIVAITEEAPQVGRCITVDSADGLYLVGTGMQPTHNSTRVACWYVLWRLTTDPTLRIAIVSYSLGKARRWGRWLRAMIHAHPELNIRVRADSRAAERFETTVGGLVLCVGIEGGITGEPVDELIIDDPIRGRAEAESLTYRENAWEWWESNASTRASNRFRCVLMMTRWHTDDLAGRLLSKEPGEWTVLRIPALREDALGDIRAGGGASVYDPYGELISVQDRPRGYFTALKVKRSAYVWRAIYAQHPVSAAGNLFSRPDFRYWRHAYSNPSRSGPMAGQQINLDGQYVLLDDCWRFITVDLAASKKTSADYTVAAAWAIPNSGELILLDRSERLRIGEGDHWAAVRPLCVKWKAPEVFVERGFIGATLIIDATRAGVRVVPVAPETDKITRAIPATTRVKAHMAWFPSGPAWLDEWCDELAEFPNGAHDDQVDVFSYAARIVAAHWVADDPIPTRGHGYPPPTEDAFTIATGRSALDLSQADW